MAKQTLITVTNDAECYPEFTIGSEDYHITLKGEIFHITTKDRGKHYGYKTSQEMVGGQWTTVITGVKMSNGYSFDNLDATVQKFIRTNYDEMMKLKSGESKEFPL